MEIITFLRQLFAVCIIYVKSSSCDEDRRHLRCALSHIPPFDFITVLPNGSFHGSGASKKTAEWVMLRLNFTISYVYPGIEELKVRGNEAAMDVVASNRADFSANGFGITAARHARVEFATYHNWEEGHRMVVPWPGEKDRVLAFIDPFHWKVWLLTGVGFVVVSFFMGFVTWASATRYSSSQKTAKSYLQVSDYLGKYFLYNINVLTTHGDYLSVPNVSFSVGVGCWLLGASVLVYGYSSIVVSSITLPRQLPSVNSLEDVVAHPDLSLIIWTDTYIGDLINTTKDVPLYNALREKASKRPESIGNEGVINSTKLLLTGRYAYTFVETAVRFTMARNNALEGKCRLKLSSRLPIMNSYFYNSFQKGNKQLAREISVGYMQLSETGLIRYWTKDLAWFPKAQKCFDNTSKKSAKVTSIKLIDLTSAFFILGVGYALSTTSFLAESFFQL